MRRFIVSAALAGSLFASVVTGALAASDNHLTPGTPGDKNCEGQTKAYLAQVYQNNPDLAEAIGIEQPGLGEIMDYYAGFNLDMKEVVEAYCNP